MPGHGLTWSGDPKKAAETLQPATFQPATTNRPRNHEHFEQTAQSHPNSVKQICPNLCPTPMAKTLPKPTSAVKSVIKSCWPHFKLWLKTMPNWGKLCPLFDQIFINFAPDFSNLDKNLQIPPTYGNNYGQHMGRAPMGQNYGQTYGHLSKTSNGNSFGTAAALQNLISSQQKQTSTTEADQHNSSRPARRPAQLQQTSTVAHVAQVTFFIHTIPYAKIGQKGQMWCKYIGLQRIK